MGWANGSSMARDIWERLSRYIPEDKRNAEARWLYDLFCSEDADDWDGGSKLEHDAEGSDG